MQAKGITLGDYHCLSLPRLLRDELFLPACLFLTRHRPGDGIGVFGSQKCGREEGGGSCLQEPGWRWGDGWSLPKGRADCWGYGAVSALLWGCECPAEGLR